MFTNLLTSSVFLVAFPPIFWLYYNFCSSQNVCFELTYSLGYWRILQSTNFSLTEGNGLLDIFFVCSTPNVLFWTLWRKNSCQTRTSRNWREHHLFHASFAMDIWLSVHPDGLTSHWEYSENDNEDEDECCSAADARAVSRAPFTCARSDAGRETWR